jgi:hypothetical protein
VFAWSGEHLHSFHIHGKEYGSGGADTRHVALTDFRLHRGERFHYVYDYIADWICDIRLEAVLPLAPRRICPVCIGGKRAAPPEECRGAWAYLERLEQHRTHPPIEAMLVVADAVSTLLEANPHTTVREALVISTNRARPSSASKPMSDCSLSTPIADTSIPDCNPRYGMEERHHEGESTGGHHHRRWAGIDA